MPVPAAHQCTLPIANAAVSQLAGTTATPERLRSDQTRATFAPPKSAVATPWSNPGPKSATNGMSTIAGIGGKGEYQPPSARGTSSSQGIG